MWVSELEKGHTIQPSLFVKNTDGKYTHAEDYWQETYFVCLDADNIQGVDFKARVEKGR